MLSLLIQELRAKKSRTVLLEQCVMHSFQIGQ